MVYFFKFNKISRAQAPDYPDYQIITFDINESIFSSLSSINESDHDKGCVTIAEMFYKLLFNF